MNIRMIFALAATLLTVPAFAQTTEDPFVRSLVAGGMSQIDAESWTRTLNETSLLDAKLRADWPNRYASLYVDDVAHVVYIKLTGGADNLLARYTTNPAIVAEVAKFSLAQLERRVDNIAKTLGTQSDHVIYVDPKLNRVAVRGKRGQDAPGRLKRAAVTGEDIDVVDVDEPWTIAAGTVGGQIKTRAWNTTTPAGKTWSGVASLGFGVTFTDTAGATKRGYVTAAHFDECKPSPAVVLSTATPCAKNQSATEVRSGAILAFVKQALGGDSDIELRTTSTASFSPSNVISYGGNEAGTVGYAPYPITSVGAMVAGQPTCKQGFASFYTCGTVFNPNILISNTTYGINGRFAMIKPNAGTILMAKEGDSGGPVFAGGNVALGIVQGGDYTSSNPTYGYMTVFPAVRFSAVGATILTVP